MKKLLLAVALLGSVASQAQSFSGLASYGKTDNGKWEQTYVTFEVSPVEIAVYSDYKKSSPTPRKLDEYTIVGTLPHQDIDNFTHYFYVCKDRHAKKVIIHFLVPLDDKHETSKGWWRMLISEFDADGLDSQELYLVHPIENFKY